MSHTPPKVLRPTPIRLNSVLAADAALLMTLASPADPGIQQSTNQPPNPLISNETDNDSEQKHGHHDLPILERSEAIISQSIHQPISQSYHHTSEADGEAVPMSREWSIGLDSHSSLSTGVATFQPSNEFANQPIYQSINQSYTHISTNQTLVQLINQPDTRIPNSDLSHQALITALNRSNDRIRISVVQPSTVKQSINQSSSQSSDPSINQPRIGMFAKRAFKQNELVMIEDPVVSVSCDNNRCDHCSINMHRNPASTATPSINQSINQPISSTVLESINEPSINRSLIQPISCPECGNTRYCSTSCLDAARDDHQYACEQKWSIPSIKQSINQSTEPATFSMIDLLLIHLLSRCGEVNVFEANPWLLALSANRKIKMITSTNQSVNQSANHSTGHSVATSNPSAISTSNQSFRFDVPSIGHSNNQDSSLSQPTQPCTKANHPSSNPPAISNTPAISMKSCQTWLSICHITGTVCDQFPYATFSAIRSILSEHSIVLKSDQQLVDGSRGFGCAIYETAALIHRFNQSTDQANNQPVNQSNVTAVVRPDKYGNALHLIAARAIAAGDELVL